MWLLIIYSLTATSGSGVEVQKYFRLADCREMAESINAIKLHRAYCAGEGVNSLPAPSKPATKK